MDDRMHDRTDGHADDSTRRAFVGTTAHGLGGAWLAMHLPAIEAAARYAHEAFEAGQAFETLTAEEAAELEAIAAQIIPSDDTPGAREAGVIHFIDRALGTFQSGALYVVRAGLEELQARSRETDPGATRFAALSTSRQVALLEEIEDGGFFGLIRTLTIQGMFAHPSHGGNRDKVGWRILGFEDRFSWQPPFGHYDAEVADG
jgi:gluconate 2-dehydrogenase gamma chain